MRNKIGIPLYKTAVTLKKMTYEELAVIEPNAISVNIRVSAPIFHNTKFYFEEFPT